MEYTGVDGVVYNTATGEQQPTAWWQNLVTTVVTAAVNKNTATLQSGKTYHVDSTGRLVADGSTPATVAAAVQSNPLLMFGLLAVGAFLLYKLVK